MWPFSQDYEPLKETLLEKEDRPVGEQCQKCRFRLLIIRLLSVTVAFLIILSSLLLYRQFGTSSRHEPIRSEYGMFLQFITEKNRPIELTVYSWAYSRYSCTPHSNRSWKYDARRRVGSSDWRGRRCSSDRRIHILDESADCSAMAVELQ